MQFLRINTLLNKNSRAVIVRSAAPARRQRGAGRQRYSKALENNKYQTSTLHRIHAYASPNITDEWWTITKHEGIVKRQEDLPSRSWRALRWRRWRGCHTRIWFWMNERGPLCSSEQTKSQAGRNCTRRERGKGNEGLGEERSDKSLVWMSLKDIFFSSYTWWKIDYLENPTWRDHQAGCILYNPIQENKMHTV